MDIHIKKAIDDFSRLIIDRHIDLDNLKSWTKDQRDLGVWCKENWNNNSSFGDLPDGNTFHSVQFQFSHFYGEVADISNILNNHNEISCKWAILALNKLSSSNWLKRCKKLDQGVYSVTRHLLSEAAIYSQNINDTPKEFEHYNIFYPQLTFRLKDIRIQSIYEFTYTYFHLDAEYNYSLNITNGFRCN